VSIRAKLLLTVLEFNLFHFSDKEGHRRAIGIENNDVGALGRITPEGNWIFNCDPAKWIAVVRCQAHNPELPNRFFRLGQNFFATNRAIEVEAPVPLDKKGFQLGKLRVVERL
jgi:hypothetical protein